MFYDYQYPAIDFLLDSLPKSGEPHRYLAFGTGTGKSPITCEAINLTKAKTVLIICPANPVTQQWVKYLSDWTTFFPESVQVVDTGKDTISNARVVIVNYELLLNKNILKQLHQKEFDVVVVDEAHRLKEVRSKITRIMLSKQGKRKPLIAVGKRKILLSATPFPNRPIEMFPVLRTLAPECIEPYLTYEAFGMHFCNGYAADEYGYNFDGASNVEELAERIKPFMLYGDLEDRLPPKIFETVYCDIPKLGISDADTPLATLRKAVGKAKLPFIVDYLENKIDLEDKKIVVFAYTTDLIIDIINADKLKEFMPQMIYGDINKVKREAAFNLFKNNERCKILVLQRRAGGTGLDGLQHHCHTVVDVEPEWSKGDFDQSMGRLCRIGQNFDIKIFLIQARNTLDKKIVGSYNKKKVIVDRLLQKGE